MPPQSNIRLNAKIQLLLSLTGLLIVVALSVFPPTASEEIVWRKPVIGSIFNIFCFLGILAVFSPSRCGKVLDTRRKPVDADSVNHVSSETSVVLQGHHPTCGKYKAHILRIGNDTYCAACIGLLIGGLVAIFSSLPYFFGNIQFPEYNQSMIWVGVAGVTFGLFQYKFGSLLRLTANIIFVVSALLILVGVDGLVHSIFTDLFVFTLIAFLLFTRIVLSQTDHEIICSGCDTESCEFKEK